MLSELTFIFRDGRRQKPERQQDGGVISRRYVLFSFFVDYFFRDLEGVNVMISIVDI